MKLTARSPAGLERRIDTSVSAEDSVVLRYRAAVALDDDPDVASEISERLPGLSLGEGSRIFPLLTHGGVEIRILDETSRMATGTLKSIDGCVSMALCAQRGHRRVAFESGANTGRALTRYGRAAGVETFFFCPSDNLDLLDGRDHEPATAHLVAVDRPDLLKAIAERVARRCDLVHVPERSWRHGASLFRGLRIAEHMIRHEPFDWIVQTVSAAFGPIGIYEVLETLDLGRPRFLGVQQEANCPLVRAAEGREAPTDALRSTKGLLTRVMYDARPQTYGTSSGLSRLLDASRGRLTTVDHAEFASHLERTFDGTGVLAALDENGVPITRRDGEIVEKTGLIALAGTVKAIDAGTIPAGSRVLCCLTSGCSDADGAAVAEERIVDPEADVDRYCRKVGAS